MKCAWVCIFTSAATLTVQALAQPGLTAGQAPPASTQPARVRPQPEPPPLPPRPVFDEKQYRENAKARVSGYEPALIEIYKLDAAGKTKAHKILEDIAEADVKYTKETFSAKMDARDEYYKISREISNAYQAKKDQAEIDRLQKLAQASQSKMSEYQKNSPMTPDKLAAAIEQTLAPAQAKERHAEFEKRKMYPYLRMPPTQPSTPPTPPIPGQPPQPAGPMAPQQAQPTKFRAVTRTAPPQDQWDKAVNQIITDRKLDAEQTAKARAVLTNIKSRVAQAEKGKAEAQAAAQKMTDTAARDAELKRIDNQTNIFYDELMLRIDNISRADQMPGAGTQPAPKPMPSPAKPMPPPAPGGH